MALLTKEELDEVSRSTIREWSKLGIRCDFLQEEIITATSETDRWIDANYDAFLRALTGGFSEKGDEAQKSLLFANVAMKRFGKDLPDEKR